MRETAEEVTRKLLIQKNWCSNSLNDRWWSNQFNVFYLILLFIENKSSITIWNFSEKLKKLKSAFLFFKNSYFSCFANYRSIVFNVICKFSVYFSVKNMSHRKYNKFNTLSKIIQMWKRVKMTKFRKFYHPMLKLMPRSELFTIHLRSTMV